MKLRKSMLAVSLATANLVVGYAAAATNGPQFMIPQAFSKASPQENASLVSALVARHGNEGLDTDHGYLLTKEHPGPAGTRITRFDHTYKGLRVLGSDSVVVSDGRGSILNASESDRRSGLGQGAANKMQGANIFDVTPTVQAQAAIDQLVQAAAPRGQHRYEPSAELVIQPIVKRVRAPGAEFKPEAKLNALDVEDKITGYELAWLVKIRMAENGKLVFRDAIVSAKDGHTLAQWNALQTAVVGVGHSQFSGDVPIQTTFASGAYKMLDPSRGTGGAFGGMAVTNAASGPFPGTVYTNSSNVWGDGLPYNGGSTTGPNGQTAAVDALWAQMNNYDLLKNTQGWLSLDGGNTATFIAVHAGTMDNAYYDPACKCMSIGDGTGSKGLASLDIIGHELGHGITGATSALNYTGESGGLNESSSDINGEMVEAYARNGGTGNTVPATGNDWMLGREVSPSGTPMRWMWKPSKDGSSKDAWTSTLSSLDPHYSSGPNNRMFYFLSQGSDATVGSEKYSAYLTQSPRNMTGIGNDKAYRIWFRANTVHFTSSTNYANARAKMIQAASELYGTGSKEAIAVTRAYAAINVGTDIPEGPQLELVKNGSFESGATSWNGSVNVIGSWPSQPAFDGSKYALFGGKGVVNSATLTQAITIPASAAAANLSFALHIDSAETTTTTAYDKLVVAVKNSSGALLATLATYSNLNKAPGYSVKTFNLLPYKGQTVVLSFSASEDSSLQTSFVVDKVSVAQ